MSLSLLILSTSQGEYFWTRQHFRRCKTMGNSYSRINQLQTMIRSTVCPVCLMISKLYGTSLWSTEGERLS